MDSGRKWDAELILEGAGGLCSVAFSPDGQTLASAGQDGAVRLWDPQTGRQVQAIQLRPQRRDVLQVAFSPEGRHLAVANGNGTVYILRLAPRPGR